MYFTKSYQGCHLNAESISINYMQRVTSVTNGNTLNISYIYTCNSYRQTHLSLIASRTRYNSVYNINVSLTDHMLQLQEEVMISVVDGYEFLCTFSTPTGFVHIRMQFKLHIPSKHEAKNKNKGHTQHTSVMHLLSLHFLLLPIFL